jgi:hypothetical protein
MAGSVVSIHVSYTLNEDNLKEGRGRDGPLEREREGERKKREGAYLMLLK